MKTGQSNATESTINGRTEYVFQTFGAVAFLFIEMKLTVGNDAERLKAVAQVIAECDGKPRASQGCTFCS